MSCRYTLFWSIFLSLVLLLNGYSALSAKVIINEIHYDPEPDTLAHEFIELHNDGDIAVDLSGWYFSEGVEYLFPENSVIPAGGYLVVAQDPSAIAAGYGTAALGPWHGVLRNEGETIVLRDAQGAKVDTLDYQRGFPWPVCPDGNSMELLNPALDNDLGGSWRSSGYAVNDEEVEYIGASATSWRYFKGTQEASLPTDAWRAAAFDDSGWLTGQTSIGYGDDDDNTTLSDMKNGYSSVYLRQTFDLEPGQVPDDLLLRVYVDDGAVVWINGTEVARHNVPDGELTYDTVTGVWLEASWSEFNVAGSLLVEGTNVVAVHAVNQAINSSDFSLDLELRSALGGDSLLPSPGEQNRVWMTLAPPTPRQVSHTPTQPLSGETVTVSTKVTDPDGVASVILEYQQVAPGAYVRATDDAYVSTWTQLVMVDDGSEADVYTATIPSAVQLHRHLIRYRITVTDTNGFSQTVPYEDDARHNFAYFVYDGVPAWTGADEPGVTVEQTFSADLMANALPVYHLIAAEADVLNCQYDSNYKSIRFYGTLIYDGRVYDHIQFKVRGEYSTYKSGKNKWRFYFNTADDLEARDNYGEKFDTSIRRLNLNACASPWMPINRGMAGLDEAGSFRLYELAGVLTPNTFYNQFRVIDSAEEAPMDQYEGDLWGLYLALEHTDGRFLSERDLPDGNVYKVSGTAGGDKRNQSATQSEDNTDWVTFYDSLSTNTEAEWRSVFDLESYYSFRGINRAVSNMDLRNVTNYGAYHHPDGHWYVIPQDLDMTYIPETHWAGTIAMKSCLDIAALELEKKNRCRELLDLLFSDPSSTGGQAVQVFHELTQWVNPLGEAQTFADVDQYMWNYHPRASTESPIHRGAFYVNPAEASPRGGDVTRTLETADFEGFLKYISDFITDTDSGSFTVGDGDPLGYGFQYLELEGADDDIPYTPVLSYTGPDGYPVDSLQFTASAFDDPQRSGTYAAVEWRIGRIRNLATPDYESGERWIYEIDAVWESGELNDQVNTMTPAVDLTAGNTYRARVRYKDSSDRWSHWSAPVQFVALGVDTPRQFILTELHYNPQDAEGASVYDNDDFEFVEFQNTGSDPLDLRGYALDGGIEFSFRSGAVQTLAPGDFVVVVRDLDAFTSRYDTNGLQIAGVYSGKLSNDGEDIRLEYYGQKLFDIAYNDARGWPQAPDGGGPSLVPATTVIAEQGFDVLDHPSNWRPSSYLHGSPGETDPEPVASLVINEVIAHTDTSSESPFDSNDQIELYNPTTAAIVLDAHWYLSDDFDAPELWNLPVGLTVPAGGWLVFDEDDFHADRLVGFGLNKGGERVLLSHRPDGAGDRIVDSLEFEGQANGASWGRFPDGDSYFQTLLPTPDASNQLPPEGVRFEQVMYHPLAVDEVESDAWLEYIQITNRSNQSVALEDTVESSGTWRVSGGVDYSFAAGTSLGASGSLWLVPFDPDTNAEIKTLFCATYGLDAGSVTLLGPYSGLLSNSGERVSLEKPQASDDPSAPEDISWVIVDEVYWLDEAPWPEGADQAGDALLRISSSGNDPLSWTTTDDVDVDGLSDRWETSFGMGLNELGMGDYDRDGNSDFVELVAGTDPTDPNSVFMLQSLEVADQCQLTWPSVAGKVYSLWVTTDLLLEDFTLSESLIFATPPMNTLTTDRIAEDSVFYRISVEDE